MQDHPPSNLRQGFISTNSFILDLIILLIILIKNVSRVSLRVEGEWKPVMSSRKYSEPKNLSSALFP